MYATNSLRAIYVYMQEARLQRAEGVEVRRQLREALAELEADRAAQARRSRTDVQARGHTFI